MSLEVDIQTAYEAQEAAETTARDLESRIRKIHGAAGLLPPRQYGQPIDRDAIAKSLTLRSLIAREDRHLAAYLGISLDTRKADAEIEAAELALLGNDLGARLKNALPLQAIDVRRRPCKEGSNRAINGECSRQVVHHNES